MKLCVSTCSLSRWVEPVAAAAVEPSRGTNNSLFAAMLFLFYFTIVYLRGTLLFSKGYEKNKRLSLLK